MCSILGASFAPGSTIDKQALLHNLLVEGEARGSHASGFAFVAGDTDGIHKLDVPGSKLSVESLPQNADAFIAHTRWATTGEPSDNRNNHPVETPQGNIRLVHNGVIHNHMELRSVLDFGSELATVDTSVIGGVIEELGLENTDLIAGDASAAWFDKRTGSIIHLARFSHSPVNVAYLLDGSFVFASTEFILGKALNKSGLNWYGIYPGPYDTLNNGEYLQLHEGQIVAQHEVEWNDEYYSRYAYQSEAFRNSQGGGGHSTAPITTGFANVSTTNVTVLGTPEATSDPEDAWDDYEDTGLPAVLEGRGLPTAFYSKSHLGDYVEYHQLSVLIAALRWNSQMTGGVNIVDEDAEELRWVNHFEEIGELVDDPEGNMEEISWIANPHDMAEWQNAIPIWVRDGVDTLRKVMV